MPNSGKSLSYADAGVDIDAGNHLVEQIKKMTKTTQGPEVLTGLGGFAALYDISTHQFEHPVLVSCTDGVGTKLKIAELMNNHDTIGIDLVAMCVNDLAAIGALPLFFLDYYATGKLDIPRAASVIKGITTGCKQAKMALVGGETAEMPGMYQNADYDLAGFVVGLIDRNNIINGDKVEAGDALIAIGSSGLHSNGYSLARKIIESKEISLSEQLDSGTLGELLLEPTHIYSQLCLGLRQVVELKSIAHITGGGIVENLPRVLPKEVKALVDSNSWQRPELFQFLQTAGNVSDLEMWRTFNCGVGLILSLSEAQSQQAITYIKEQGYTAWQIGHVETKGDTDVEAIELI